MTTLTYPSDLAPALPSVAIDVPEGWSPITAADVLLAVGAPSQPGKFRTNVTVSSQRVLNDADLAANEVSLVDQLKADAPDLEEGERFAGQMEGLDARVLEYAFSEPAAGTLFQIQVLVLTAPTPAGVRDLVQIHLTCAAAAAVGEVEELRSIIRTIHIN